MSTQEAADNSPFAGQDISESSSRIPLKAEPDFRELKKEKTKYYKHECHQQNLKLYREKGMIPEGLRLNATPYVSDMTEEFKAKWEVILRSASEMLLDLLIAHHEQALQTTWNNITCMEKNIKSKYGEELAFKILQLGNEIAKKDKEKLQEKAQSKLVKRSSKPLKTPSKYESFDNNSPVHLREESPNEGFRSRDKFGGSGRRPRASRSNSQRSYVGMGRGRKSQV